MFPAMLSMIERSWKYLNIQQMSVVQPRGMMTTTQLMFTGTSSMLSTVLVGRCFYMSLHI